MAIHLHIICLVLTMLLLGNTSTQECQTACSAEVKCGSPTTQCCLGQYENDPAPMCAPLAQEGERCTRPMIIRYRGGPVTLPKVFTAYCPCSAGLTCTGNETKYCI